MALRTLLQSLSLNWWRSIKRNIKKKMDAAAVKLMSISLINGMKLAGFFLLASILFCFLMMLWKKKSNEIFYSFVRGGSLEKMFQGKTANQIFVENKWVIPEKLSMATGTSTSSDGDYYMVTSKVLTIQFKLKLISSFFDESDAHDDEPRATTSSSSMVLDAIRRKKAKTGNNSWFNQISPMEFREGQSFIKEWFMLYCQIKIKIWLYSFFLQCIRNTKNLCWYQWLVWISVPF